MIIFQQTACVHIAIIFLSYNYKLFLYSVLIWNLIYLLQNHRSDVADITPLLRIGLVSDKLIFLLG